MRSSLLKKSVSVDYHYEALSTSIFQVFILFVDFTVFLHKLFLIQEDLYRFMLI